MCGYVLRSACVHHGELVGERSFPAGDIEAAKAAAGEYEDLAAGMQIPFEVRQSHELAGMIALAAKDARTAVTEFEQASQRDPRVLYQLALACHDAGDDQRAAEVAAKAAAFNELNLNFVYVKNRARQLVDQIG